MSLPFHADYCTCKHKDELRRKTTLDNIDVIFQFVFKLHRIRKKKRKFPTCQCHVCGSVSNRLHACVSCATFSCWTRDHCQGHFDKTKHPFAIEFLTKQIYCFLCNDYVYDSEIDRKREVHHSQTFVDSLQCFDNNPKRIPYSIWKPTKDETNVIQKYSETKTKNNEYLCHGLRGLNNLGNTCFMSCILQSFVHNPPLRNFFLSGQHKQENCVIKMQSKKTVCLACEMDFLFKEFFNGDIHPYSPHQFLHSLWKHASHLAGYEQKDAHEFFIAVLNGTHLHCQGTNLNCKCIIHRVFTGALRSDVMCLKCGDVSTTIDPFWDISLDLHERTVPTKSGQPANTDSAPHSLVDCLKRFTKPERLGSDQKILCGNCNSYEERTKQLSLRHLPIVVCFHLKRFEHSSTSTTSTKIKASIEFPAHLNIAPYLSSTIVKKRETNSEKAVEEIEDESQLMGSLNCEYSLFTVVNHHGSLDSGHYISFVKHGTQWFQCDDGKISIATTDQVLNSEGYLLFYIKKTLEYETNYGTN